MAGTALAILRESGNGKLPTYAWPGGYPFIYVTRNGNVLCADCAETDDDEMDPVAVGDIHWEGAPEVCENCNKQIESAYGDPDADE